MKHHALAAAICAALIIGFPAAALATDDPSSAALEVDNAEQVGAVQTDEIVATTTKTTTTSGFSPATLAPIIWFGSGLLAALIAFATTTVYVHRNRI